MTDQNELDLWPTSIVDFAAAHVRDGARQNLTRDDPNVAPRLLTVAAAAQALGIGRSTAYGLIATGQLASVRIGNSRRIPVQALDDFVARLTNASGYAPGRNP